MIFGELVPKSIALMHPETIGLWTARTIDAFSKIASIFVKILTFSTAVVLRPFGEKTFHRKGLCYGGRSQDVDQGRKKAWRL